MWSYICRWVSVMEEVLTAQLVRAIQILWEFGVSISEIWAFEPVRCGKLINGLGRAKWWIITSSREFSPDFVHVGDSDVANLVKKVGLSDAWGSGPILGISFFHSIQPWDLSGDQLWSAHLDRMVGWHFLWDMIWKRKKTLSDVLKE